MLDLVTGIFVGVVASLVGWWIVARGSTPLIAISPKISKVHQGQGGNPIAWRYRIKYRVERHWWLRRSAAVDVRVTAILRVFGHKSRTWNTWTIDVGASRSPYVQTNRIVPLNVEQLQFVGTSTLAARLREVAAERPDELEPLLLVAERAEVRIVISAADAYTGARRTFMRSYTIDDIVEAKFERNGVGIAVLAEEAESPTREAGPDAAPSAPEQKDKSAPSLDAPPERAGLRP